jgi:hypothetical protein
VNNHDQLRKKRDQVITKIIIKKKKKSLPKSKLCLSYDMSYEATQVGSESNGSLLLKQHIMIH